MCVDVYIPARMRKTVVARKGIFKRNTSMLSIVGQHAVVQSETLQKAVSLALDVVASSFETTALRAAVFSNKVAEVTIAKPGTYISTSHAKVMNRRVQVPDCFDVDDLKPLS